MPPGVKVVAPVPPLATVNAAPDQLELLILLNVASVPRPSDVLAVAPLYHARVPAAVETRN